jgi:hypothetical protein
MGTAQQFPVPYESIVNFCKKNKLKRKAALNQQQA